MLRIFLAYIKLDIFDTETKLTDGVLWTISVKKLRKIESKIPDRSHQKSQNERYSILDPDNLSVISEQSKWDEYGMKRV